MFVITAYVRTSQRLVRLSVYYVYNYMLVEKMAVTEDRRLRTVRGSGVRE